ncbi:MAG: DUF3798 domain-containing protein [Deltaproteobacteria bacterium]|nr:DUF3798 domain-containing protein [Deltaproteobacteria bacterium]
MAQHDPEGESKYIIGVVTGPCIQTCDEYTVAMDMIKKYGAAESGGLIKHVTYPEDFVTDMDKTIKIIENLSTDPLVKAIVVNQGVPGTSIAFKNIKQKRPDIKLLVSEIHEDPIHISSVSDLVVSSDFIARGYLLPLAAKKLGAKTFVHISFPRHMIKESINRRKVIMEEACKDLGLKFASENAPDPIGEEGLDGVEKFLSKNIMVWLDKYGKDTAFFSTNESHTAFIVKQVAKYGGYFIESDLASPLIGYPKLFNINLSSNIKWQDVIKEIDTAVVEANLAGRFGTWTASLGYCHTAGLISFAKQIIENNVQVDNLDKLLESYSQFSSDIDWNGSAYRDSSGHIIEHYFLLYQDTYIFGQGFLGNTAEIIPEKYFMLGND